jgi:hypothetical protein
VKAAATKTPEAAVKAAEASVETAKAAAERHGTFGPDREASHRGAGEQRSQPLPAPKLSDHCKPPDAIWLPSL